MNKVSYIHPYQSSQHNPEAHLKNVEPGLKFFYTLMKLETETKRGASRDQLEKLEKEVFKLQEQLVKV